MSINTLQKDF